MKYLVTLIVILVAIATASAQTTYYQVQGETGSGTVSASRNMGANNQYTGYRINGGTMASGSTVKVGVQIWSAPLRTDAYLMEWGVADSSSGASFQPKLWWRATALGDYPSPKGYFMPDGTMVDPNGIPVDPFTGEPDPLSEHAPKAKIGLTNPWDDRPAYFQLDLHDAATGDLIGTENVTLFPGESRDITYGRGSPFTVTPYLMVDGTRNSWGSPVSSSGSGGSGSTAPPTVVSPPTSTTTPPELPNAVTGTTETKLAVDRVGTILGQQMAADAQNATLLNNSLQDIEGAVNEVNNTLQDGINVSTAGGGGITPADLNGALQNSVDPGADLGDGGLADGIAEGEDAAAEIPGIATSIGRIGAGISGLIDSVGLGASYGTTSLVWNISLPVFGSMTINAEVYSWLWDLIRQVTLWCFAFVMVGKFLKLFVKLPA